MFILDDFRIVPKDKFASLDLTMFTYVPETPNDAYQFSTQEKIRAFNNSCVYLCEFYESVCKNYNDISQEPWDSENNRKLRQLFGLVYKELFSYQEKIVKFVLDLLHVQQKFTKTKDAVDKINEYSEKFDFIKNFVEKCYELYVKQEQKTFREIRADEVHNINQWDMVNYDFVSTEKGIAIVATSYKTDSKYFYDNIMTVVADLIALKNMVEEFTTEENVRKINKICKIDQGPTELC